MKLITQSPKKSLNKAFLKQRPLRSEIDLFKKELIEIIDNIDERETEEFHKYLVSNFLKNAIFLNNNSINTKGSQDLVIHLGKDNKTPVGIIIEAKRPKGNQVEMISIEKPNGKALHELILYYFEERISVKNHELKNLVVTNIYEWFLFDANEFDKHIYRNTKIKNLFETYKADKKDTKFFYEEINKILATLDENITCTYFDIRDYDKALRNTDKEDDKNLIALFKILSPSHSLKVPFADDSNKLDTNFYKELLHIIGLEEVIVKVKKRSKQIIRRKEDNRNVASLLEMAIHKIKTKGIYNVADVKSFGETAEEQYFNIALELCITWINRILFLKLLEGQLVNYQKGDKQYRFFNTETINDFGELFKLFHEVLAVNVRDREIATQKKYSRVPCLNSSLFELSELEKLTISVESLDNTETLELISTTVLKEHKKKTDKLQTLEYLYKYLDAYDFASEGTEEIQEDKKTLINSSVLGKVFEKINGYKDGSIFTPGFITMYMSRKSLRLAVVQIFKEKYGWNIEKFDDIKNYIADKKSCKEILEFNALLNSIKMCDPAVGSGHFLVSLLNEMIAIKAELGLLANDKGERITGYDIIIENDELIITDSNGDIFEYKNPTLLGKAAGVAQQRLQKTLFHEKQTIIENCLFGVDINPNSVKICCLRLWIELLKNAYYKEETNFAELETLPNIDINIKCGNSLVSRFSLDDNLSKALKSTKYDVEAYRNFVNDYKNCKDRKIKRSLQEIIDAIKSDFRTEIDKNDPKQLKLNKRRGELKTLLTQTSLFEPNAKDKRFKKEEQQRLEAEITKLTKEIEQIKNNAIYKNAFEWRFEFPEVLNNKGEFEGFDIVIANPPYGISITKKENPQMAEKYEIILKGEIETYILFYFRGLHLLQRNGYLSYITPDSWFTNRGASLFREWLTKNHSIIDVYDWYKPFEEAKDTRVHTVLLSFSKNNLNIDVKQVLPSDPKRTYREYEIPHSIISDFSNKEWRFYLTNAERKIFNKMEGISQPLERLYNIKYGLRTGNNSEYITEKETKYPLIAGADIASLYKVKWKPKYLKKTEGLPEGYFNEYFTQTKIIVQRIRTNSLDVKARWLECAFVSGNYIPLDSLSYIYEKTREYDLKYLLGVLNSFLMNRYYRAYYTDVNVKPTYLAQLPISTKNIKTQKNISSVVDEILSLTQSDDYLQNPAKQAEAEKYKLQIDQMVYKLYDLTPDEKAIVAGK